MRALVISGGGSKGAFAGGIAHHLIHDAKRNYDLFLGTSTGSLLVTHLAAGALEEIREAFTNVNQSSIFSNNPFIIRQKGKANRIKINHFNVLKNFLRGKKTFGESQNLRDLIGRQITPSLFELVKKQDRELIICVSNFTLNKVEYKALSDCSYTDFLDWIWISCNYVPFMSLVIKDRNEYADGGFGCIIAIEEALRRGATEVDAIMLSTEVQMLNRMRSRNAFDLLLSTLDFMGDQITQDNLKVGNLIALQNEVKLQTFFTPRVLTTQSLVFNKEEMELWWQEGRDYAASLLT
ncbi:patatin-like phospholipase family protein [Flavobacteriaceae bacterium]|nr:patatin-like phospholipase family protein [Flavobacteriaceae bacterium]